MDLGGLLGDFGGAVAHDSALGGIGALTGMVQGPQIAAQLAHAKLQNDILQQNLALNPQMLALKQLVEQHRNENQGLRAQAAADKANAAPKGMDLLIQTLLNAGVDPMKILGVAKNYNPVVTGQPGGDFMDKETRQVIASTPGKDVPVSAGGAVYVPPRVPQPAPIQPPAGLSRPAAPQPTGDASFDQQQGDINNTIADAMRMVQGGQPAPAQPAPIQPPAGVERPEGRMIPGPAKTFNPNTGAGNTKPPAGYRRTREGDLEAIPGGPADLKLQGTFNQDTARFDSAIASYDRLATAANQVLNHPGLGGITGKRGVIPNIPGSDAANAAAKLETLKSQIGFAVLQEMRNNSKTGGALGQVSDFENRLLQNNLDALANSQSEDEMKNSLRAIIGQMDQAKDRVRNAYNTKYSETSPLSAPTRRAGDRPSTSPAPSKSQYVEVRVLPDGRRIGMKANGEKELIP